MSVRGVDLCPCLVHVRRGGRKLLQALVGPEMAREQKLNGSE